MRRGERPWDFEKWRHVDVRNNVHVDTSDSESKPRGRVKHPLSLHVYTVHGGGVYRRGVSMSPPHSPGFIQRPAQPPLLSPDPETEHFPRQRRMVTPPAADDIEERWSHEAALPLAKTQPTPRPSPQVVRTHSVHGGIHVHIKTRQGGFIEVPAACPQSPTPPPSPPSTFTCPHECGVACKSAEELQSHLQVDLAFLCYL